MDGDMVMATTEKLDNFVGIMTGYKGKLVAAGFSVPVAEQMCLQLHGGMLTQAFKDATAKKR